VKTEKIFVDNFTIFVYDKGRGGDSMSISANIKALLTLSERKVSDLMGPLRMSSRQSLSNKFTNERWSAQDLTTVAELCGCKLAFIMPNGQQIIIDDKGQKKDEAPGE